MVVLERSRPNLAPQVDHGVFGRRDAGLCSGDPRGAGSNGSDRRRRRVERSTRARTLGRLRRPLHLLCPVLVASRAATRHRRLAARVLGGGLHRLRLGMVRARAAGVGASRGLGLLRLQRPGPDHGAPDSGCLRGDGLRTDSTSPCSWARRWSSHSCSRAFTSRRSVAVAPTSIFSPPSAWRSRPRQTRWRGRCRAS